MSGARGRLAALLAAAGLLGFAAGASAHCDTRQGPVVADARLALERGDPTPVLKWVGPAAEGEVRAAFASARQVRALGAEARALADDYFFETLVRLHRAGEGAPYTGLKDVAPEPVIRAADSSLAAGSAEELAGELSGAAAAGVRARFGQALEARRHAEESVAAGREYVAAYVELTHYLERLDAAIAGGGAHGDAPAAPAHAERGAAPAHAHR